jgi:uncharacterized damage-inducible protein DinB
MTTLALISSLYRYHEWADSRLLEAAARVPEEELCRAADIPFGSVKDNLLHILGSQVSWVMRLTGQTPQLGAVEAGRVIPALRESFAWAHEGLSTYLRSLTEEDIERVVAVVEFEGNRPHNLQRPLWEILLSVGSHGIAHRSEVSVVLARLGADPDQMDYSEFAWRHDLRNLVESGRAG